MTKFTQAIESISNQERAFFLKLSFVCDPAVFALQNVDIGQLLYPMEKSVGQKLYIKKQSKSKSKSNQKQSVGQKAIKKQSKNKSVVQKTLHLKEIKKQSEKGFA